MAVFRKDASGARTVLSETNAYGSRTLVVERDDDASAAYLCDSRGTVQGAVWLANHGPAPAAIDLARINAGRAPMMPHANTAHPAGREPLGALEVLWFEEGDGVALYEGGDLLAVIPGWADMARGMPGYARDAVGETPFAWSLREALEGLGSRLHKARMFWQWRSQNGAWDAFQQVIGDHLRERLGQPGEYWELGGERMPRVGAASFVSTSGHAVMSTIGMSCQRMPAVEQYVEEPNAFARIELAMGTRGDRRRAGWVFRWLAQYPWHSVTWLGNGHTAKWHQPTGFPLGEEWHGVLLIADPRPLAGPALPDLGGFRFGGDPVRWLWLVPIAEQERRLAASSGHEALVERLIAERRSWISGPQAAA